MRDGNIKSSSILEANNLNDDRHSYQRNSALKADVDRTARSNILVRTVTFGSNLGNIAIDHSRSRGTSIKTCAQQSLKVSTVEVNLQESLRVSFAVWRALSAQNHYRSPSFHHLV